MASARRQGADAAPIEDFPAEPSPGARAAMEAFADFVGAELREGLRNGLPYAFSEGGQVLWMHPDGLVRIGAEPSSALAEG